jgi:hypothetical protein
MKSDQSIKNIVVASIRRHSMDMNTWVRTRLWDEGDPVLKQELSSICDIAADELPILYSYIDQSNWTLVTTRRVWHSWGGLLGSVAASEVVEHRAGNFKGYGGQASEVMIISARNSGTHHCPFETGKPSMGAIYAVRTVCNLARAA